MQSYLFSCAFTCCLTQTGAPTKLRTRVVGDILLPLHIAEIKLDFIIYITSGFWPRVRARALRAPVFLGPLPAKRAAARPPAHRSFAAPPKIKK
jgi:hypothetical protein